MRFPLIERIPLGVLELDHPNHDVGLLVALEVDAVWRYDPSPTGGVGCPGLRFRPAGRRRFHEPAVVRAFRRWQDSYEPPSVNDLIDPGALFARYRSRAPIPPECLLAESSLEAEGNRVSTESLWQSKPWLLPTWLQRMPASEDEAAGGADRLDQYWHVHSSADLFGAKLRGTSGTAQQTTPERGDHLLAQMRKWRSLAFEPQDQLAEFATAVFGSKLNGRGLQKASSYTRRRVQKGFGKHGIIVRDLAFKPRPRSFARFDALSQDPEVQRSNAERSLYVSTFHDVQLVEWIRSPRFLRILDIVSKFQRHAWSFFPISDHWDSFVERRKVPLHRVTRYVEGGPNKLVECVAFLSRAEMEEVIAGSALEGTHRSETLPDGTVEVTEHAPTWKSVT